MTCREVSPGSQKKQDPWGIKAIMERISNGLPKPLPGNFYYQQLES
jgi:hypothetical protein